MAWTAPRTFVTGEVLTAAIFNTHLRDNLLMTAPALVTTKGDIVAATGANALSRLGVGTDGKFLRAASGQATGLLYDAVWVPICSNLGGVAITNGATIYVPPFTSLSTVTNISYGNMRMPAGTLSNLRVYMLSSSGGASGNTTVTVYVNSVASALTLNIAAGAGPDAYVDNTHTVDINDNDLVEFYVHNGYNTGNSGLITEISCKLTLA